MFGRRDDSWQPKWVNQAPPPRSYRSIFKWGAPHVFKHPNRLLYSYLKEVLGLSDADFQAPQQLGEEQVAYDQPSRLSSEQLDRLRQIVGEENVKLDDYSRLEVAYGKTMLDLLRLRRQQLENLPDAVVCPRSADDVRALVRYCDEQRLPLTPFGGGTSVTRGVECTRGGLSLDLRPQMCRILELNPENQTVTVEPGIFGPALERELNAAPGRFGAPHRYTCGHFPQSFEYSTVGGWVVTRGAGQASTTYGKIEDLVLAQTYVTPAGDIITQPVPAAAVGPDIDQIMIGSEGAYGVLVAVTLRIFRYLPESRAYFSFILPSWDKAVDAMREVLQGEFGRPAVFRLSDPEETEMGLKLYGVEQTLLDKLISLRGYTPGERCLVLGTVDGQPGYTRQVKGEIKRIMKAHGALYTTGLVTKMWEKGRYRDPYLREDLLDYGVIIDTLECAVTWDKVRETHAALRRTCHARPHTACLVHMSHLYPQGTNLYIIFLAKMDSLEEYRAFHASILDTIRGCGAALSHHHGIGKLLAPWLEGAIGPEQLALLQAIKRHLDPHNILNPGGTLALDLPPTERR